MTGLSIKNKSLQNIIKSSTVDCLVTEKYRSIRTRQKSVYTSTGLNHRNVITV